MKDYVEALETFILLKMNLLLIFKDFILHICYANT